MKRRSKTGNEVHHRRFRCEGGSDDPSNLVLLTEYEHAEIHAWEFINGGPWFDYRMNGAKMLPLRVQHLVIKEMSIRMSEMNNAMVRDGTHPSFREEHRRRAGVLGSERFKTLNGINPDWELKRITALQKTHAEHRTCPHCGTTGMGTSMLSWHFDNCPVFTGVERKQKTLTCPHCNLTGGQSNMRRYHFDNCKNK